MLAAKVLHPTLFAIALISSVGLLFPTSLASHVISSRTLAAKVLHPTLSAIALISSVGLLFPTYLGSPSRYVFLGLPQPLFLSLNHCSYSDTSQVNNHMIDHMEMLWFC